MVSIKEYKIVETIDEAYELNQKRNNAVIAGMGWIKMQKRSINTAIDLSSLGLDKIEEDENTFKIGAMVTLRELETHKGINDFFGKGIKESLCHIVGVQFRNCATIGGSIRMRFGFSDVLTVLLSLGAEVQTYKKGILSLEEYSVLPYDRDILTHIILKKEPKEMVYDSLRNSFSDLPVLNVAVTKEKGIYSATVGAKPFRAERIYDTENILTNEITKEKADQFASFVTSQLVFNTNKRATKAYREHLSRVLICRGVLSIDGGNSK